MKAGEVKFQKLLDGKIQYVVPLFQRTYSWEQKNWERLWDDILELYALGAEARSHFIGAVVTLPIPDAPERVAKHMLIDGQQRLTTLLIILSVIRASARQPAGDGQLDQQIFEECLVNKFATHDDERLKLLPTQRDREVFAEVIAGNAPDQSTQIGAAWRFFDEVLKQGDADGVPISLPLIKACVTDYLDLVSITLDQSDSPHRIFESLNHTGMQLGPSDLVRNYLFMRIPDTKQQEYLYNRFWYPMQEALPESLSDFFWRYLMMDGLLPRWDDTFDCMRDKLNKLPNGSVPDELERLSVFAGYYQRLRDPAAHEPSVLLKRQLHRLNSWEVDVAYPFLLNLLHLIVQDEVSEAEVLGTLISVESFVVRRTVCGVPTNRLRRVFARMSSQINTSHCMESSRQYLMNNEWPSDEEFLDKFQVFRLYVPGRLSRTRLVLQALEQSFGHKEIVADDDKITIEHIMPQSLTDDWSAMLGTGWESVHNRWLHTVGNLTLTGYNPDMGNQPFPEKKKILQESHFELNKEIVAQNIWDESGIRSRAERLGRRALSLWKR